MAQAWEYRNDSTSVFHRTTIWQEQDGLASTHTGIEHDHDFLLTAANQRKTYSASVTAFCELARYWSTE